MRRSPSTTRLLASAAMLVALTACSNPPQNAKAPDEPRDVSLEIHFHDDGSGCKGTPSVNPVPAKRKLWIHWLITQTGCNDFSINKVTLVFTDNVVNTKEVGRGNGTDWISAKVSKEKSDAPNGLHTYTIEYDGKPAGDPDIDVNGDCMPCMIP